ncbi:MAG: glycosyltransferase family 2 protein [Chitinophagales bacterium]
MKIIPLNTSSKLSIILPCYNPQEGWMRLIYLSLQKIEIELKDIQLIIVNDGSSKNVNESEFESLFAEHANIKFISYTTNQGKGYALREGVKVATGELIIYTDIDFPYAHESFLRIYNALIDGQADVAIGIRGEEYYTHLPKARVRISKILRWFIKFFLRIPTDDTQCGLKGFNQKGREVFLQTAINRYLFDLEFIFLAARKKLKLKTIEVQLRPDIVLSKMNWKILMQEFGNFLKIFFKSVFC